MKSKRMKSMLLISLAMLVVAGVIWGSFSAVSVSAAARTGKSAEQNARCVHQRRSRILQTPKMARLLLLTKQGSKPKSRWR